MWSRFLSLKLAGDGGGRQEAGMSDRILIVDDDRQLTSILERFFACHGYDALSAGTAAQMEKILAQHSFSLIVLDLILPDIDGIDVARSLRRSSDVPLIMLTARDEVHERSVGLEVGADDYLTKPYEPHELLARVRSVLRRSAPRPAPRPTAPGPARLLFGGLPLDRVERRLSRACDGETAPPTSMEFSPSRALVEADGDMLTQDRVMSLLYGTSTTVTDRRIDAHIARLRRKIAAALAEPPQIKTIHGTGYVLTTAVRPAEPDPPTG